MLSNKVREIMGNEIISAEMTSAILAVMEQMAAKNVGRVVIASKGTPVGIFTEKDVLRRVMNKPLDPRTTSVKEVMTSPVRTVHQDSPIVDALKRMYEGKFRRLLVQEEKGRIVGIISMRRILKLAVELGKGLAEHRTIGSIMSGKLVTVEPSTSIHDAIETMIQQDTGCIVVASAGQPKGIFTERDVLKRVAVKNIDTTKTPIHQVMTPELVTAPESALIGEVLAEMYNREVRNMPITGEGGKLAGIVSMGDVLQYAKALDIDEAVRKAWQEVKEFWDSETHYTPG
ncbi:MAG: CBS domain-containing protein [Deltaproteobacteria bacterium]|nr:CBS domain-containing protein [Deltaproteobacteria bacterium]